MTVYLLRARGSNRYKIGTTSNLEQRIKHLQATSPTTLDLIAFGPGGYEQEAAIHAHFQPKRVHGEWFALSRPKSEEAAGYVRSGVAPVSWRAKRTAAMRRNRIANRARQQAAGLVPRDGRPRASKVTISYMEPREPC